MARVYADVNANMPRAYWDYDSVNISWGVLENYEVVRKIGRPTAVDRPTSEAQENADGDFSRAGKILGSVRGHQRRQLPEMRHQGAEAGKEEEDKTRDQDPTEPFRRAKYRCTLRCSAGQSGLFLCSNPCIGRTLTEVSQRRARRHL